MIRLLLVEDEPDIRELLTLVLSERGYEVLAVADGAIALDEVGRFSPALILLDMRMPVMDGWSFARAYRQTPTPHAALVVMTASRDARCAADEVGAEGYVAKPFDLVELFATLLRCAGG